MYNIIKIKITDPILIKTENLYRILKNIESIPTIFKKMNFGSLKFQLLPFDFFYKVYNFVNH
jgi:hypothetical protein